MKRCALAIGRNPCVELAKWGCRHDEWCERHWEYHLMTSGRLCPLNSYDVPLVAHGEGS